MIRCHRRHLEDRCRERGYTLDEVMPCVVEQDGDNWTVDETHEAYPRPGLGDAVAAGLNAVGITKARVTRLLGKPCKCLERQQRLNEMSHRLGLS